MGTIYRNGTAFIGSGGAGGVELTQAEYDALPTSEKMNGAIYFISDGEASYPSASTMRYDNSSSGLDATSVQAAVDEVNEKVNDNASDIAELNADLTGTITRNISSGTLDNVTCIRKGNWVTVSARLYDISVAASGRFFMIPVNFRPSGDVFGFGYMNITGVGWVPMLSNVHANGEVGVAYSAGSTCTQVGFFASYPVDD